MGKTLIKDLSGNQTTAMHITVCVCGSSYVQLPAVWALSLLLDNVTSVFTAYCIYFVCFKKQKL